MKIPLFFFKIVKYEYWPMWVFYLPIFPYYIYLAFSLRSWSFFTASNPGIYLGGFFGESKEDILKLIDPKFLPRTIYIESDEVLISSNLSQLEFPVIAKPDVGERGNGVEKIHSMSELMKYHASFEKIDKYLVQEFIDYEFEFGVFYSRLPNEDRGVVSSLTGKDFMTVKGDGAKTILELMQQNTRYRFQIERFKRENQTLLKEILNTGEVKILEPIGNHCRGTRFINNNDLINDQMTAVFDEISKNIKGFYFGRFDLKVRSLEDFYAGRNIKIMELNGASSEPGHVYDIHYSLLKAYRDICWHWKRLSIISKINIKSGIKPATFSEIWTVWKV